MSESNLEQLLPQLKLLEPSTELDGRVAEEISGRPVEIRLPVQNLAPARSTAFSGFITAALLIGCATGYLIRDLAHFTQGQDASSSVVGFPAENKDAVNEQLIPDATLVSQFKGPAVGIMCALASLPKSSDLHRTECQDCHSGKNRSEEQFRERHMAMSQFTTCTLCHAADVPLSPGKRMTVY